MKKYDGVVFASNSANQQSSLESSETNQSNGLNVGDVIQSRFFNTRIGKITDMLVNLSEELKNLGLRNDPAFQMDPNSTTQLSQIFEGLIPQVVRFRLNSVYNSYILSPTILQDDGLYTVAAINTSQSNPIPVGLLPLNKLLKLDCRILVEDDTQQNAPEARTRWGFSICDTADTYAALFNNNENSTTTDRPISYLSAGNIRYYSYRQNFYINNRSNNLYVACRTQNSGIVSGSPVRSVNPSAIQLYIYGYETLNLNTYTLK